MGAPRGCRLLRAARMALTADERRLVMAIWKKVDNHEEELGAEALDRLFLANPSTKTYFPHFDLSPGSADIKAQGKKVITALTMAVNNLDNLDGALSQLSDLHATKLRVDPVNFELLNHSIMVTLAAHDPAPMGPPAMLASDKFLRRVARALTRKYR